MLIDQNYYLDNICRIMGQKQYYIQIIKFKKNALEVSTVCTGTPVLPPNIEHTTMYIFY